MKWNVEKERWFEKMEISMKDIGKTIKQMVLDACSTRMAMHFKPPELTMSQLELAPTTTTMVLSTQGSGKYQK